jgi:3-mercaptopyruvate sulfurtransferase SseA
MKPLRECVLLLGLAMIPALFSLWLHPRLPAFAWHKPEVDEVTLDEMVSRQAAVLWVDARADIAYQQAHIPGAVSLPQSQWDRHLPGLLEAWRPGMRIVVYCDSKDCGASQSVAQRIQYELNLPDVHVLKGGWNAWLYSHR